MNIHKKEYITTLDEYNKLVNSLDDANKLNYKLIVENLELQSNINELVEFIKILDLSILQSQNRKLLIQKHTKK